MKKLIAKSILFVIIGFIILNIIGYWIINNEYLSGTLSWGYVQKSIRKSKQLNPEKIKVIILGESVANQFFPLNKHPNSLTTSAAVLMPGQYILAYNAIKQNPNLKYIVLMFNPITISSRFEQKNTYNNFLKPFYSIEYLPLFNQFLLDKISQIRLAHMVIFPFVKTAPLFSDTDFRKAKKSKWSPHLYDITIQYLQKIKDLCHKHNIELVVVSTPLRKGRNRRYKNWETLKKQVKENRLGDIFKGYFENIIYIHNKYLEDGVHLKKRYLQKNRQRIISRLLPKDVYQNLARAYPKRVRKWHNPKTTKS
jgi:hypothetical protein